MRRVLKKVLHKTASVAFLFEPNDLAVSVTSIGSIGGKWKQRPEMKFVASDHVCYFTNEAAVKELRALLE